MTVQNAGGCETGIKVNVLGQTCIHVIPQPVEHGVVYNNVTENGFGAIEVKATAHGIESETTNHPLVGCPTGSGGTETHDNGSYTGPSQ